jgi:hypothetical protein
MTNSQHIYEVRPRKDHRGFDPISDALPFGRLWSTEPNAVRWTAAYGWPRRAAFPFAIGGELSAISLRGRFVNAHRRNFAAQQL